MAGKSIDGLTVGDAAEFVKTVTRGDIDQYARATGDANPLHLDRAFARRTIFGEPIAQGMLSAGIISAALGTRLPGPGTIYLAQELRFLRPVKIGDTITARVEVIEVLKEKNRVRLQTTCRNQHGDEVLFGTALVMPPALAPAAKDSRGPTSWTDALVLWQRMLVSPLDAFGWPAVFFGPAPGVWSHPVGRGLPTWQAGRTPSAAEMDRLSEAVLLLTRRVEELARKFEALVPGSSQTR